MPPLPSLPFPILLQTAAYLSTSDAINLASISSALRDIGESRVWRDISLRLDSTSRPPSPLLTGKAKEHFVPEAVRELPAGKTDLLQGAMEYLTSLFAAHPRRLLHVRRLDIACQRYPWDGKEQVGEAVVHPGDTGEGSWEDVENQRVAQWLKTHDDRQRSGPISHPSLARTFANIPSLPAVQHLHLDLFESWDEYTTAWRTITPNVKHLSIKLHCYPTIECLPLPTRASIPWTGLQSLRFETFGRCMAEFATRHLEANPNLKAVALGSWNWQGQVKGDQRLQEGLMRALGRLEGLGDLAIPAEMRETLLKAELVVMPDLLSLGTHLHFEIASYLPLCDAKSLARTCSQLQDAGESQIWQKLHLNFDDNLCGANPDLRSASESLLVKEGGFHCVEQWWDDLQAALDYLGPMLIRRPKRCSFVREIDISCDRAFPWSGDRFFAWRAELYSAVGYPDGDGIRTSDTKPYVEYDRNDQRDDREYVRHILLESGPLQQPKLAQSFADFPVLPAVRTLQVQVQRDWYEYMVPLQRVAPNVVRLTVHVQSRGAHPTLEALSPPRMIVEIREAADYLGGNRERSEMVQTMWKEDDKFMDLAFGCGDSGSEGSAKEAGEEDGSPAQS
ncbi:uncharacterized protein MKK02DRAFT_43507 [Dioszegia hungarica]|uniref:F-box domain-containing protein n=1 Tax=Dioszegia hungarica TaxID=4972 RepID=A0AA38HC31_9TREE|nr:uncharacterized protein MKK02DRAFT_43507 [Dioszegia hungarica]KAI9637581.1 hypothetical protein MKK02DRAFT_43507 [Dioszegia hungarica]